MIIFNPFSFQIETIIQYNYMFQLSNKISPLIFIEEDDNTITISSIGGHFIKFNSKTFTIEQIIQFPFECPLAPI